MDRMFTIHLDDGDTVEMSRHDFQVLHSAGRALFKQATESYDHTKEATAYLVALDQAIIKGHEVLNTDRPSADEYVYLVHGVTEAQREHARTILENEGLTVAE